MKKKTWLQVIGLMIVFLFVYTALSKLLSYRIYYYDLQRSPELGRFATPISIIIPGLELIAAALILFPLRKRPRLGYWIATGLMTAFTLYVAYVIKFADEQPCTCGGIIRQLTWPQHLVFNIVFTALCIIALRLSKSADASAPPHSATAAFH